MEGGGYTGYRGEGNKTVIVSDSTISHRCFGETTSGWKEWRDRESLNRVCLYTIIPTSSEDLPPGGRVRG